MKRLLVLSSALALGLMMGTPGAIAHVGHGDEFQAEGGVNRVEINPQTDPLLGIEVKPIEPAPDGGAAVLIPVSALVEDNDRQLVFVQYENFYEPVDVTTGDIQGERIAITDGLSVGEQLVTQGSLSLYAESRKTQTASGEAAAEPTATADNATAETAETATAETTATSPPEVSDGGMSLGLIAAIGSGVVAVVGAIVFISRQKQGDA